MSCSKSKSSEERVQSRNQNDSRFDAARKLIQNVSRISSTTYQVVSGDKTYQVDTKREDCFCVTTGKPCPDNFYRGTYCKHQQAADLFALQQNEKADSVAVENTQDLIRKDLLLEIDSIGVGFESVKETLYDRDETKLIERVENLRKDHPDMKVGQIQRPLIIGGTQDGVFEVEVEF